MNLSAGSLVVTETGDLVMLTSGDREQGEMQGNGVVPSGFPGVLLLRTGRFMNFNPYLVNTHRSVGHIRDFIEQLAKQTDISTPAEKPESELTALERLAKVERENAALKAAVGIR